jgi:hypothetical protein
MQVTTKLGCVERDSVHADLLFQEVLTAENEPLRACQILQVALYL